MRRREFITLLSSAAAWPLGAHAQQQPERMRRIGVLTSAGGDDPTVRARYAGFTPFEFGIVGKWLELLKEIAPRVTRAAIVRDATISAGLGQWGAIQAVAPSLGLDVSPVNLRGAAEIERAVVAFARTADGGLI